MKKASYISFFEMIKSYFALKITANNQKMSTLTDNQKQVLGFRGEVDDYDI